MRRGLSVMGRSTCATRSTVLMSGSRVSSPLATDAAERNDPELMLEEEDEERRASNDT